MRRDLLVLLGVLVLASLLGRPAPSPTTSAPASGGTAHLTPGRATIHGIALGMSEADLVAMPRPFRRQRQCFGPERLCWGNNSRNFLYLDDSNRVLFIFGDSLELQGVRIGWPTSSRGEIRDRLLDRGWRPIEPAEPSNVIHLYRTDQAVVGVVGGESELVFQLGRPCTEW